MKTDRHLWVLEDDPGCVFVYREILDIRYQTRYFETIEDFVKALKEGHELPELVIVDLYLKDACFLDFLAESDNKAIFDLPFLIVSSLSDVDALRFCFEEGALDYLVKPFQKNELLVKLERLLMQRPSRYSVSRSAMPINGVQVEDIEGLTRREMHILKLFLEAQGKPVSRQTLMEAIWKGARVHPKTLDVHLYNLRKKLQVKGLAILSPESGKWMLINESVDPDATHH